MLTSIIQYRAPIDKVTIEVPAGLIDEGETVEEAAIRELKEETGYVAKVSETSPMMFNGKHLSIIVTRTIQRTWN